MSQDLTESIRLSLELYLYERTLIDWAIMYESLVKPEKNRATRFTSLFESFGLAEMRAEPLRYGKGSTTRFFNY